MPPQPQHDHRSFSQRAGLSFGSSHRGFQHHLTHPRVRWLCCRQWKALCIFMAGKRGQPCAEPPGLQLAGKGSAPLRCQTAGTTYAFSPHKSIFVRRVVSACTVPGLNALVFFGEGLRKMMVWPWTFPDLKRERPSFSRCGVFFSVSR